MRNLLRLSLLAILLGYILPVDSSVTLAQDTPLQIAFETNLPHNDICVINIDGTDQQCLMQTDDSFDYNPVWSPDGHFIVYHSVEEPVGIGAPTTHLYALETQTTTTLPYPWNVYAWSPNGLQFLMVGRTLSDETSNIYTMGIDDSNLHRLTRDEQGKIFPAWSPDGTQIAYLSGYPDANLIVMSDTGEDVHALTRDLAINREVQPVWSPDSSTIAFVVNGPFTRQEQTSNIYTVQRNGTHLWQLTDNGGVNLNPRWSPDGTQLVFYGYAVGAFDLGAPINLRTEVFRINADGSDLINLTQETSLDYHPAWSPDGEWIAFASTRESPGIFIMRPDGSDLRMVTNEPPYREGGHEANNPVWRPLVP